MWYFIFSIVVLFPYHSSVAGLLLDPLNNSLSVTDSPNSVDVSGVAKYNSGTNLWEYRYTISETSGVNISNAQFVIKEDVSHENMHHEEDILTGSSNFQWDGTQRPGGNPFVSMLHNYSWFDISIAENSSILLGFDDIHGPNLERWQIYLGGATPNYIQVTAPPMQLPVPSLFPLIGSPTHTQGIGLAMGGRLVAVSEPYLFVLFIASLIVVYCLNLGRIEQTQMS